MKAYRPYRSFTKMKLAEIEERLLRMESTEDNIERILCMQPSDLNFAEFKTILQGIDAKLDYLTKNGFKSEYDKLDIPNHYRLDIKSLFDDLRNLCPPNNSCDHLTQEQCIAWHRAVWYSIALFINAGSDSCWDMDATQLKKTVINTICSKIGVFFTPKMKDTLEDQVWCFLWCDDKRLNNSCLGNKFYEFRKALYNKDKNKTVDLALQIAAVPCSSFNRFM